MARITTPSRHRPTGANHTTITAGTIVLPMAAPTPATIMVLGHWIEMRSISQAQGALKELAKLLPDTAVRIVGDRTEVVPVSTLREGDLVLVRPRASIPADA